MMGEEIKERLIMVTENPIQMEEDGQMKKKWMDGVMAR